MSTQFLIFFVFFFFKQKTAYEIMPSLVGSEMCIRDRFLFINTIFAIFVAIMLNEVKSHFVSKLSQTLILIPYLLSYVVISYIIYAFLGQTSGMINNSILKPLGVEGISWYTKPEYWPFILTMAVSYTHLTLPTIYSV